jgi:hypothetical protein
MATLETKKKERRCAVQAASRPPCGFQKPDSCRAAVTPNRCLTTTTIHRKREENPMRKTNPSPHSPSDSLRHCSPLRTRSSVPASSSTPRNRPRHRADRTRRTIHLANQFQQIENGTKIFTNTVKIATTALQTYNTVQAAVQPLHQMMNSPQMLYRGFCLPAAT